MARPNILTIITLTKKIQDSAKPINESHKAFDAAMRQFESSARIRALDDDLNKLKALTTLHSKYISRFSNSNEHQRPCHFSATHHVCWLVVGIPPCGVANIAVSSSARCGALPAVYACVRHVLWGDVPVM